MKSDGLLATMIRLIPLSVALEANAKSNPMKKLFLAALLTVGGLMTTFAQNPILPDFHADPSARVFDGTLYLYPSHDAPGARNWKQMADWHVFSSDDLVSWNDHGVAFGLTDIAWATEEAWAADCIERNGKYYFYFTAGGQIGVAVSDSPTGPFKDALGEPLVRQDEAGIRYMIDPNIFIDDDGQAYLYVGGGRRIGVVKLKDDMITRDGPLQRLEMAEFYEGVWVHKRDGRYYASYPTRPEGENTRANVMVYSMAKGPLGPWEFKGPILDNRSLNVHGSITEFQGRWYLFYHAEGPSHWERRVCMEPLSYNADGTIKPLQMTPPAQSPLSPASAPLRISTNYLATAFLPVSEMARPDGFSVAADGHAAPIHYAEKDAAVVRLAAQALRTMSSASPASSRSSPPPLRPPAPRPSSSAPSAGVR